MKTLFTFCLSFLIIGLVTAQNIGDTFSYTHASHTIDYEITSLSPNQVKAIGAPSMISGALEIPPQVNNTGNNYAVVKINESAFWGDNNTIHAITSVSFPEGLVSIESASFQGNSISSVIFPSTITEISDNSFSDNLLTTVTIPALVTYLGDEAFSGNAITAVQSESLSPATLYSGTFDNRSTVALTIPYGTMADYTAAQWTGFLSITEDISINPFNGVAINTDTSGAALHVKGFTDLAGQPNLKLSNASGNDLLTIYDDGTVSGTASEQWTELPEGGQDGQILQTDGNGNYAWVDTTASNLSQLEQITEGGSTGWRLLGSDPDNYGDIGEDAVDLSISTSPSSTQGATGDYSTAMGRSTIASGYSSMALGGYAEASGYNSTALGRSTTASGNYSTALGVNTTASESYSTAMGRSTTASGINSTAMGYSTTASGYYSTTMGFYSSSKSFAETVVGSYNTEYTASGSTSFNNNDRAFVVGIGNSTSNRNDGLIVYKNGTLELDLHSSAPSITFNRLYVLNNKLHYNGNALGGESELEKITENSNTGWRLLGSNPARYGDIGTNALDLSYSSSNSSTLGATGPYSAAMGRSTTASGSYSTGMGYYSTASGSYSTAMGRSTTASGLSSTAMGSNTTASGIYSTAMGRTAIASGSYSTAMGRNINAKSFAETVVGLYNTDYPASGTTFISSNDRAFVVGIGASSTNTNDGLIVYKNGTLELDSLESAPSTTSNRLYVLNDNLHYNGKALGGSELEKITEDGNTGWRLANFNPSNYGNIGQNAVDLSYSNEASNRGATGDYSTAMGWNTVSRSFGETALGTFNTNYTATGTTFTFSSDRAFVVGYGTSSSNRKDAMTILKNGKVGIKHDNFENTNANAALQVNGTMRLTNNNGGTCNANNAGTIRYLVGTGGNGKFYGCCQETDVSGDVTYSWKLLNN